MFPYVFSPSKYAKAVYAIELKSVKPLTEAQTLLIAASKGWSKR